MTITVKARYAKGQLTPLEPLDWEEGPWWCRWRDARSVRRYRLLDSDV